MKCKNKIIIVYGVEQLPTKTRTTYLECIITNDEMGKTLSINNGVIQFSVPFEPLEKWLR